MSNETPKAASLSLGVEAIADIRRRSKSLEGVFLVAVIVVTATLVGKHVVWPIVRAVGGAREPEPLAEVASDIGLNLVSALPAVLLLVGAFAAYRVFGRMRAGDVFSAANARNVRQIGQSMIWAAVAAVLITPSLSGWIRGDTTIDFAFPDWALVVAVLGFAVLLLERVLALGGRIKAENDEIV